VPNDVVQTPVPPVDDGVAVIVLKTVGQTAVGDAERVAVGLAKIVIVCVALPEQPLLSVTVMVAVYVPAGALELNIGLAILVLLKCVAALPVQATVLNVPGTEILIAVPAHSVKLGVAVILGDKLLFTVTVTCVRGLSQPFTVCDTHQLNVPGVVVTGVGALPKAVPLVATVYHFKLLPVAVSGVAGEFTQYDGLFAVGAAGIALIVTFTVPAGPVHPATVAVTL